MRSLETIRDSFHSQFKNIRKVHRLVHSDDFAIAYGNASRREKAEICDVIVRADRDTIVNFIEKQILKLTPFHQMTVRQLREIGRNISIPKYWDKDKSTLIEEIENVVERLKKGRQ
jgi:hypothetical protein